MHEINSNTSFSPAVRLDAQTAGGIGALRLDGPAKGWKLHVTHQGGHPVHYGPVDGTGHAAGKVKVLKPGDSATISARTELWTAGVSSLTVEPDTVVIDGRRVAA